MSNWKKVDLRNNPPKFPGLVDLDAADGTFVSIIVKTPEGLLRIRKSDYNVHVEKEEVETKKTWRVTWKMEGLPYTQDLEDEDQADRLRVMLVSSPLSTDIKVEERETPIPTAYKRLAKDADSNAEGLPF